MGKHIICLYDQEANALQAITLLKEAGFNHKHISLLGKANTTFDGQIDNSNVAAKTIGVTSLVGILAGIGLTMIPGVGLLFGIGAAAGAVAGFDVGLIGGIILSVLEIEQISNDDVEYYNEELKAGKTLLSFKGNEEELKKAQSILEAHGSHVTLRLH